MQLPYLTDISQMLTKWRSILNPFLGNPSFQSHIITGVPLVNGTATINHGLGRKLVGWRIIGINAAATVHDNQANNATPDLTLLLVSSAAATANIEVF